MKKEFALSRAEREALVLALSGTIQIQNGILARLATEQIHYPSDSTKKAMVLRREYLADLERLRRRFGSP